MFGKNPIRPPAMGDGARLAVQEIFPTLQGEGPHTGAPSIFIRLGGCNLACSFCDTEFEDFRDMPLEEILSAVKTHAAGVRKLVVITGGEPLRQPIAPLCEQLLAAGFQVQIETNGTLYRELPPGVEIICSPKNAGKGYFPIRPDLLERVTAFKFILSRQDPLYMEVPEVGQSEHNTPVYVQPMDEYDEGRNRENRAFAQQIALDKGYRFSLQLHKILGIP